MNILDIFYNEIVPEASKGNITSYFTYNVLFDTFIKEENKLVSGNLLSNGVVTPLLIINNKSLFDKYLIEYVKKALEFYENSPYLEDIIDSAKLTKEDINIEKNIMTLLWSNATFDDFANPIEFLKRRIAFMDSKITESVTNYGNVSKFSGDLEIRIEKDEIYNETPYQMVIILTNNLGEKYEFPLIKFGIDNNIAYIYAIQNRENENNNYAKKINRLLYKVNTGFDDELDKPEIYGIGNLKDISASFLVALNIALSYLENLEVSKVVASSILLTRWNAKRLAINKKYQNLESNEYTKLAQEQERIQHNLTEKFLRTFLRLKVHYDGIEVLAYPFDCDSNLHLDIGNLENCNNELLESIREVIITNKNKKL